MSDTDVVVRETEDTRYEFHGVDRVAAWSRGHAEGTGHRVVLADDRTAAACRDCGQTYVALVVAYRRGDGG